MADEVYTNRRGETVIPYHVFSQLSFEAIMKSAKTPYPPKRRISSMRPNRNRKARRK